MHSRTGPRLLLLTGIALSMLAAGGCRKKLTFERWEALQIGESKAAVKSTLGKPLDDRGARMTHTNQDEGIAAEFWFDPQTGRLIYTQWTDPVHGIREKGTAPNR